MNKKNKIIVSTIATGSVVAAAGVGIGLYLNNADDVNDNKTVQTDKVKKSTVEKGKYNKIAELIENVGVPTIFDEEEKSPFQTVYISNGFTNDVYVEFMVFTESGQEMRYVIKSNGDQFNLVTKDDTFEVKELEEGLKVYTNGSSYYWYDKEKEAYLSIESLNPDKTKAEDLEKALQSVGESTFDITSKIDFGFSNINVPSYTVGESEPMELIVDYQDESIHSTGEDNRVINLIYTDVEIGQSKTFDFTKNLSDEEKKESVEVNGEKAYVYTNEEDNSVRVYYKYEDTSYVLQVSVATEDDQLLEDTEYAKEELLKVLKSMSFK